ncbi:MAG TPA: hypothetical protein ENK57_24475, partial [Polyangiaceae bacterium]|nr:hypothetical protein [Polyangiaceae bacterium]
MDGDCADGEQCLDGRCVERPGTDAGAGGADTGPGRDAGPAATLVSISIEPATAALLSVDGATPTQTFSVVGTLSDATTRAIAGPTFSIDPVSLGTLDVASGAFVANGLIGGSATVTATVPNPAGGELTATATVTVRLERTLVV